jgi:hypothetical protein
METAYGKFRITDVAAKVKFKVLELLTPKNNL